MGWRGAVFGAMVGGSIGRSLGAIFGAAVGHWAEKRMDEFLVRSGFAKRGAPPGGAPKRRDPHAAAYAKLGTKPGATEAELRAAYRAMAKKYHPDTLRSGGMRGESLKRATERMSEINAAWAEIKASRGMK
jgi:DnaJ like chaperone protein